MTIELQLEALEARVLGVLIEKELTTPDQYPLSLNGVTLGTNQKNNRDPVLDVLESDVNVAIQKLIRRSVVGSVHPLGSRVEKYRHNAGPLLSLEAPQLAVLAELLLRGPQAPGELRGRVSRMSPCDSLERLAEIMRPMIESGLVRRLDPLPGTRAERYAQTLAPTAHGLPSVVAASGLSAAPASAGAAPLAAQGGAPYRAAAAPPGPARDPRVGPLEELVAGQQKQIAELDLNVARLRRQLDQLAWQLGKKLEG